MFLVDKLDKAIPDGQFFIISEISVLSYSDQNQEIVHQRMFKRKYLLSLKYLRLSIWNVFILSLVSLKTNDY